MTWCYARDRIGVAYHINVGRGTMTKSEVVCQRIQAYHINVGRGTMTMIMQVL